MLVFLQFQRELTMCNRKDCSIGRHDPTGANYYVRASPTVAWAIRSCYELMRLSLMTFGVVL